MQWHPDNDSIWPEFEKFLKSHIPSALGNETTRHHFIQTLLKGSGTGALKPMMSAGMSLWMINTWGVGPQIWVDTLRGAAALFNKTAKVIVVNRRIVRTFEVYPTKQDYVDALEMLMLHELLHWGIDWIGGTSEHSARGGNDIVYDFEKAVYSDAEKRDRTLDNM